MALSWGQRRRVLIIGGAAAVLVAFIAILVIAIAYDKPTCVDNKQNQNEEGIDCGGSCQYLCKASVTNARTIYARPLSPVSGRTDVIALVENPNRTAAAKDAHYTIELRGDDASLIAKKEGSIDLPPGTTVPVFIPGLFSGYQTAVTAFFLLDDTNVNWYRYEEERVLPVVGTITILDTDTPRITAVLQNPSAYPMRNVQAVVTVFDAKGNVIGASQTVLSEISARGKADAVFTWPDAFPQQAVKAEVRPTLPLTAV
ncbi:MAG: hypothetical protein JWN64_764 [Parcubacteria group bacterium]|nr:hypothetical protein [Parcubacteria group bacterium]